MLCSELFFFPSKQQTKLLLWHLNAGIKHLVIAFIRQKVSGPYSSNQIFLAIICLRSLVSRWCDAPWQEEASYPVGMAALMSFLILELPGFRALRAECNHSPPIWNNEVWRVIVEQVASQESLQDCTWHAWCAQRRVTNTAQECARARGRANVCRLNPWMQTQSDASCGAMRIFAGLRLIISCKFAATPVINALLRRKKEGKKERWE